MDEESDLRDRPGETKADFTGTRKKGANYFAPLGR